jgi:hypothetical protein
MAQLDHSDHSLDTEDMNYDNLCDMFLPYNIAWIRHQCKLDYRIDQSNMNMNTDLVEFEHNLLIII